MSVGSIPYSSVSEDDTTVWYPPCVKWQRGDRKLFFAQVLLPFGGTAFENLLLLSVGIVVIVRGIVVDILSRTRIVPLGPHVMFGMLGDDHGPASPSTPTRPPSSLPRARCCQAVHRTNVDRDRAPLAGEARTTLPPRGAE
eukprot:scaffold30076_cov66-Phaeocystis_antarctica.AAC.4